MRHARESAIVLAVGLLAGCNATYTVDIANRTERPVEVRLLQDLLNQDPLELARARLAPGGAARLGPVEAPYTDDVNLEVGQSLEPGLPPDRTRLYPGASAYDIVSTDRAWSGVEIRKRSR